MNELNLTRRFLCNARDGLIAIGLVLSLSLLLILNAGAVPSILSQSPSTSVLAGGSLSMSVTATGSGTYVYQRSTRGAPTVSLLAGRGRAADGIGTAVTFRSVNSVALDGVGSVCVADTGKHKIRIITNDGVVIALTGTGAPPSFVLPS